MSKVMFLVFIIMFYGLSVSKIEGNEHFSDIVDLSLIGLFAFTIISNNFKLINRTSIISGSYLFVLLSGISSILNNDSVILKTAILVGLVFILCFSLVPILNFNINKMILLAIFISHIPIILIPLFQNGVNQIPYQGVFNNPNTFGGIVVNLFSALFSIYIMFLQKRIEGVKQNFYYLKLISLSIILIYLMYLVTVSASRTSFITLVMVSTLGIIILGYYIYINNNIAFLFKRGILYTGIPFIIFFVLWNTTSFSNVIQDNIFSKFERKIEAGDFLDSRGDIWLHTLSDLKPFGQGSTYFLDTFNLGAHNTFIQILGINGYVPASILLILLVSVLWLSIKYALQPINSIFKYSPFIFSVNFIVLSFGENMLLSTSMLLMLFSLSDVYSVQLNQSKFSNKVEINTNKNKLNI